MYHGDAQRTGISPFVGPVGAPTLQWKRNIGGPIISSPVIAPDGSIVLGSVLEDTLHPSLAIVATNPDGTPKWSFPTGFVDTQLASSPAIAPDGTVYVGAQDGLFYAIDSDGSLDWAFEGEIGVFGHPVIAPDGTVYVSIDGDLHAFDGSGTLLWKTSQGDLVGGGPSLATDGTIYAWGGSPGAYSRVFAFNPDGTSAWSFTLPNSSFSVGHPPVVGPDGTIHVAAWRLYALNPNGTLKWTSLSPPLFSPGAPAVDDQGNVYYGNDWDVWKVNAQGGVVWNHLIQAGCGGFLGHTIGAPLVDAAGRVYLGLGNGKRSAIACEKRLLVLAPNGTLDATFTFGEIAGTSSPALAADGTLYIGNLDGYLYALR